MKRLKLSPGNNTPKFKLLFFDEKMAAVNIAVCVICLFLTFAYGFMTSNFPSTNITLLEKAVEYCYLLWFAVAVIFLFSWSWITDQMRRFAIKKRIRGIIVFNNILNVLVLLFGELCDVGTVLD